MEVSDVIERLELIAAERGPGPICRERVEEAMIAEREVRSWLDAANAALVSKLSATASFPEAAVAGASRCSQRDAHRAKERADTLDQTVAFASRSTRERSR